jgi:hypothetical protein
MAWPFTPIHDALLTFGQAIKGDPAINVNYRIKGVPVSMILLSIWKTRFSYQRKTSESSKMISKRMIR